MANAADTGKVDTRDPTPWTRYIVVFLAPAAIIYSLFSIFPLLDTIRFSFYAADGTGATHFTGFSNFVTLLTDPAWAAPFWNAFRNNLVFFAVHMLVQNSIGLALAVLLSLPALTGRSVYRTLIFLPTMLSVVIIGFIWQLILSPLWGIAKGGLTAVHLGGWFAPWLGLESTALITISLISVWQFVGIPMMLIYAALLGIPRISTTPPPSMAPASGASSGRSSCRSSCRRWASSPSSRSSAISTPSTSSTRSRAHWPDPTSPPTFLARFSIVLSSATSWRQAARPWAPPSPP